MPIYTRRGDKGRTKVYGTDQWRLKTDPRVEALGTIDELNAQLGVVFSLLSDGNQTRVCGQIRRIQRDLLEIGSELATAQTDSNTSIIFKLRKSSVLRLERIIDFYWSKLPPLSNFIFPGGTLAGAELQVARSVCRRAERAVIRLSEKEQVNPNILSYINRLSDCLHTLSRWVNHEAGIKDEIWIGSTSKRKSPSNK